MKLTFVTVFDDRVVQVGDESVRAGASEVFISFYPAGDREAEGLTMTERVTKIR